MIQAPPYNPQADIPRPYVQFELRPTEDRTQPAQGGTYPLIDKPWAVVRAAGSKDSLEKPAEEWLSQLREYAKNDRIPRQWPAEYQNAFELWKKGEEIPVIGTPIKNWPPLTPAQRKNILNADIFTVEDLARANEQMLANIGMQAHMLKNMAEAWVKDNAKPGETARVLQETMVELQAAQALIKEQAAALEAFKAAQPKK